jgi:hypothetical protein
MTELFHVITARLKTILTAHVALEVETDLIAHHIHRKANLLKLANTLEKEGLNDLAAELRQHAGELDPRRPVGSVLPLLTQTAPTPKASETAQPVVNGTASAAANGEAGPTTTTEPPTASLPVATPAEPPVEPTEPTAEPSSSRASGTGRRKTR